MYTLNIMCVYTYMYIYSFRFACGVCTHVILCIVEYIYIYISHMYSFILDIVEYVYTAASSLLQAGQRASSRSQAAARFAAVLRCKGLPTLCEPGTSLLTSGLHEQKVGS